MASNINLPSSLSHLIPNSDGFVFNKGTESVQIQTISGEIQTRKRNIKKNDLMRITYLMTTIELKSFNNFYETTLESGTKSFNITHPILGTQIEIKIINSDDNAYSISNVGAGYYDVSLSIEVL